MKPEFSGQIFGEKIFKYQITWKSVQWERNCSMWTDRPTDRMKIIIFLFWWFCATRLKTAYTNSPSSLLGVTSRGGQHTQACMLAVQSTEGGFAQDQFSALLQIGTARSNFQRETASRKATTTSRVLHSTGTLIFNRFHLRSSHERSKANCPASPSPVKWHSLIVALHLGGCVSWRHNTSQTHSDFRT